MPESDYLKCPVCKTTYHHKAERCPNCNQTVSEAKQALIIAKQKAEKKVAAKEKRRINHLTYCPACGSTFKHAKMVTRGNLLIEIILWLFFLLPGLIYSIWRMTTRYKVCPTCGSATIIPANSPVAQRALSQQ